MKKFNRVLAMLLALITVLATLPISVLADDWLNVDADKTKVENVTSTDVTVTVDPKALLSYIQDGDIKGLLKGVSATGGLGSIMTKKELLAIFPEEQIIALAKSIISDIDAKALLDCIDADKLLACVDTDGLIALLKDMDLKSYIRDIDVLMNYVDKKDIESAVSYIDAYGLIGAYPNELTDLVMELDATTLVGLIDDEKALALFTDDELVDMALNGVITNAAVLKEKLQAKLQNGDIEADQVVACLTDYTAAVATIGVNKAVSAIPGGYKTVLDYVTDFKGLIGEFDIVAIAKGVLRDGVITKVIDAKGLIMDINVRAFVSKVDVKQLIKVIYAEGVDVAKELFGMLDFEAYIVDVFSIIATMQTTISEIKIDGVAVTTQNDDGFLKLNPTKLFDGLENLIPTLDELANLDDSGKLFSASFAISYYEDDVEKTKEINFNFVLTAGTDMIRRAAAKLSAMLDKIGYADLTDGKLVAEVKVPSEFASVLRIALEKMADSSDPAMNALKDKVLAAYAAQPDDFIAFAKELTLEEIITVLEAIDPALFGKVYNKVLASHYAEVLISYIERFVDKELSDNFEVKRLIKSLETIPTFEELVEKLENVVGIEITDHLPAKVNGYLDNTAYDVIEKLASAAGYEFDMENLLKAAAASSDPFAYLYTAVVNKAENASGVYNFVKRNAIRVADRLMATRVGNIIADNCLMDFYAGDSKFVFEKSVTFDAKVLIEKGFNKVLNFVGARISVNEEKANELLDFAMDTIFKEGPVYMTTGFDVSVRVNNLYRVTFKDNNGKVVLNTLLPVGTDLSKMLNYANYEGAEGWVNVKNGDLVYTMLAEDIVVKATVEGDIETEPTTPEEIIPGETTPEETTPEETTPGETTPEETTPEETTPEETTPEETTPEETTPEETTPEETTPEETTPEETTPDEPDLIPDVHVEGYEGKPQINETDPEKTVVSITKDWNEFANGVKFQLSVAFLTRNAQKELVLTAVGKQSVTFSSNIINALIDAANGSNVVIFSYKAVNVTNNKQTFEVDFLKDSNQKIDLGDFGAEDVHFGLPFAGANGADGVKTFVEIDDGTVLEGGEDVTINANGTISFNAPHFSTYTIVNKYRLSYNASNPTFGLLDFDEKLVATINGSIATIVDGWYEEGATVQVTVTPNGDNTECEYFATGIGGTMYNGNSFSFQMPAAAVTAEFYAKPVVYKVYYYVNGDLTDTDSYSVLDYKYGNNNTDTFKKGLLKHTLGDGKEWKWFGSITPGANIFLFGVNDQETQATVTFKNKETGATIKTYTHSINDWRKSALAALKFTIDSWTLDNEQVVYNWKNDDNVTLADLTINMLIASTINSEGVVFYGEPEIPQYQINIQGDATIEGGKTEGGKTEAAEGATIKVVPSVKAGYTATITVQTVGGDAVDVNSDGIFTMPASDVIVIVSHTLNPVTYQYITITVPAGSVLNATDLTTLGSAPADMVLYKAERTAAGELKLTYRYIGTINEAAFRAEVDALIASAQYATSWIVDGVVYNSEAEAMNAELPEGATIVGWTEMSDNVKVAIIEYTAPKAGVSVWVIVCIILVVLLLIAVIALVYVLHITDKIGASWLTKVCTAIVSVFFAFCMILAKATLKVLNFMGIKTEDILEELPEEEPVEDIPAVILDFEIPAEETAEEAVAEEAPAEEATEEAAEEAVVEEVPAEEATEEAAEEAVVEEAPAEEATEEAAEEAVAEEAPVEEATEEVAEEVVEEAPVEEAAEEAAEEVVEEAPVEEATEEAAEEAVAEEAPVEEATEEAAEEAVAEEAPAEEATEEAAEEAVVEEAPAEEATEEAAEEAVVEEAPAEEATEEAAEEAVAEEAPAEEATEEAAEEAVAEEAPVEEATEEAAEEAVAEEAPTEEATEEAAEEAVVEEAPAEEATEEAAEEAVAEEATEETSEEEKKDE